jgi:hypothetical protein
VVVGQMEAALSLTGAANLTNLLPRHYSAPLRWMFSGGAAARVGCDWLSVLDSLTSLLGDSINWALAGTGWRTRMLSIFQSQGSSLAWVRS